VVVSVTEGPYTLMKHPFIFREADVIILNKVDMARAMRVNARDIERDAKRVNPYAPVIRTNALRGRGIGKVIDSLGLEG